GGLFRYHTAKNGDGFVTTERAALDGHPMYYVQAAHIGVANHGPVVDAVYELLENGHTNKLEQTPPVVAPSSPIDDGAPVEPPSGGRGGQEVCVGDVQALADEILGFVLPAGPGVWGSPPS